MPVVPCSPRLCCNPFSVQTVLCRVPGIPHQLHRTRHRTHLFNPTHQWLRHSRRRGLHCHTNLEESAKFLLLSPWRKFLRPPLSSVCSPLEPELSSVSVILSPQNDLSPFRPRSASMWPVMSKNRSHRSDPGTTENPIEDALKISVI